MLPPLTSRQRQIYDYIVKTIQEKGFPPSIPEIGTKFKITSTNGVSDHLKALEKKGYIRRVGRRALEVLNSLGKPRLAHLREVPMLGRIAAGKPVLSEENIEGFLTVPGEIAPGREVFGLKVKGDSMIEAGILDGDCVTVKRQDTAENGELVCALVNGEATLKRYFKKGNTVTLKPENPNYRAITVSHGEFRILGKVVGLVRKL